MVLLCLLEVLLLQVSLLRGVEVTLPAAAAAAAAGGAGAGVQVRAQARVVAGAAQLRHVPHLRAAVGDVAAVARAAAHPARVVGAVVAHRALAPPRPLPRPLTRPHAVAVPALQRRLELGDFGGSRVH